MKEKELVCPNKYCYVHNVLQTLEQGMAEICHNCGFDMEPFKTKKKKGDA